MRTYAGRLLLFLTPALILGVALEALVRRVPTAYSEKAKLLGRTNPEARLLIFGSSHEAMGINTDIIPGALNLAHVSQSIAMDRRVFQRFKTSFPSARRAILGLSYFSFEFSLESSPESFRLYDYWHYYGLRGEFEPLPFLDSRAFSQAAAWGAPRLLDTLLGTQSPLKLSPSGWIAPNMPVTEKSVQNAETRVAQHIAIMNPRRVQQNTEHLAAMIHELRASGIEPTILVTPVSRAYRAAFPQSKLNNFEHHLLALAAREAVQMTDYSQDPRFDDSDFQDLDHLSDTGARKFAHILLEQGWGDDRQRGQHTPPD
jgi:hypothetical protein